MFVHVFAIARLMKEKKRKEKKRKKESSEYYLYSTHSWFEISGKYFSFAVVGGEQIYCFVKESLGSYQFIFTADSQSVWERCYWKQTLCHEQWIFQASTLSRIFLYNVLSLTVKVDEAIRHIRTYMWIVV